MASTAKVPEPCIGTQAKAPSPPIMRDQAGAHPGC